MNPVLPARRSSAPKGHARTILGLDPGSQCFGYAVIRGEGSACPVILEYGIWKKKPLEKNLSARLLDMHRLLESVFERHRPDIVSIEQVFYHKNVKSAVTLAHARAMGLLLAAAFNAELREYSPRSIKLAVTGRGGASKEQVRSFQSSILGKEVESMSLDSSDALAAALCAYYKNSNTAKPPSKPRKGGGKNGWTLELIQSRGLKIRSQ